MNSWDGIICLNLKYSLKSRDINVCLSVRLFVDTSACKGGLKKILLRKRCCKIVKIKVSLS